MSRETDRKRLLELFRGPLSQDDVLQTPDVLSADAVSAGTPFSAASRADPAYPAYTGSARDHLTTPSAPSFGIGYLVGVGIIVLLLGIIVYLLVFRHEVPSDAPRRRVLDDDNEEDIDGEVAGITDTISNIGSLPVSETTSDEEDASQLGDMAMKRATRGMPQMGQMRPANLQTGGGGGATSKPPQHGMGGDHKDGGGGLADPMFQTLQD